MINLSEATRGNSEANKSQDLQFLFCFFKVMKSLVIFLHIYFRSLVPCTATEAQRWFYIILSSKLGLSEQSAVTDFYSCR